MVKLSQFFQRRHRAGTRLALAKYLSEQIFVNSQSLKSHDFLNKENEYVLAFPLVFFSGICF